MSPRARILVYIVVAVLAVALAPALPLGEYMVKLLLQASSYAIAVLGLTVLLGYTGQISLAQAAFFGLGAYGVALGTTTLGLDFLPALILGLVVAMLFGIALG